MSVPKIVLVVAFITLSAALLLSVHAAGGYQVATVLSGSMEPSIRTGSLLVTKKLAAVDYRQGDVVAFKPPFRGNILVAHRLSRLYLNPTGVWVAETKGDANGTSDPWTISLGNIEGKKVVAVPYAGYVLSWIRTSFGFLALISLSFFLCVLGEMRWIAETFGRRPETR